MTLPDVRDRLEDFAPGGRVGLIALATDYNSESDLRHMFPAGVEMFTNRVLNANPVTLENLRAMRGDIARTAAGILPVDSAMGAEILDVILYGCTSGVVAIGETALVADIHAVRPGVAVSNPVAASTTALDALGASRITVLTPYTAPINSALAEHYRERGLDILNIEGFCLDNDLEMTRVPVSAIVEAACEVCHTDAEALFISCTALRAAAAVEEIERRLNIPVVTSNQALAWHALHLMGNRSRVTGFGRLFDVDAGPARQPDGTEPHGAKTTGSA